MKPAAPTLIDILQPPVNPWLKKLLSGRGQTPPGVRVVRFEGQDDPDTSERLPEARSGQRAFAEA